MAAVVIVLAAFAPPEITGAVGLATALVTPFFAATGGNLRMLSVAGGAESISPITRARARLVSLVSLGLVVIAWLASGQLTDTAIYVAAAVCAWRAGDLAWDELALRREVDRGPTAAASLIVARHSAMAIVALMVAMSDLQTALLLTAIPVAYALAGAFWLGRAGMGVAEPVVLPGGLKRALALSIASVTAGLGMLLLRQRLAVATGTEEVGVYFSVIGPLGIIGVAVTGLGLYANRDASERGRVIRAIVTGVVVAMIVLIATLLVSTVPLPEVLSAGSLATVWRELHRVAVPIAVLAGATVVSALQEPVVVARRRERGNTVMEIVVALLLAVALFSAPIPMTWQAMVAVTAGWMTLRAASRSALAGL
jgi:hypothetical protein